MPSKVRLKVLSGPITGEVFTFDTHDAFVVGRHASCHARLRGDRRVSRYHFLLEVDPPDVRLQDLSSRNGTYVNGIRLGRSAGEVGREAAAGSGPVDLHHLDRILVGRTEIEVEVELECIQCHASFPVPANHRASRLCPDCQLSQTASYDPSTAETQPPAEPGLPQVPGYRIERKLGKGGMGVVYYAHREQDGRLVALKTLLPPLAISAAKRETFLREIDVIRTVVHSNIVELFDHGIAGRNFFFAMEYCNAGTLAEWARRWEDGRVPAAIAVPILLQCLEGLTFLHQRKFVHRDLKPRNILLHLAEGRQIAKLADFGLAKNFENAGLSGMTVTGAVGGSIHFMPREQVISFKYAQPTADIWSLSATFYWLLSGQYPLPFSEQRDPIEVLLEESPVPIRRKVPAIPDRLAEILDRGLCSDPAQRYPTAEEMRADVLRESPAAV